MDGRVAVGRTGPLLLGEAGEGEWVIGGVGARRLAREYGTPLYVMDEARLRANCRAYVTALREVYPNSQAVFASKALCCMAVCRLAYDEGLWIDVVSTGEIRTALRAGVPAGALLLHGSNKTAEELTAALEAGVVAGKLMVTVPPANALVIRAEKTSVLTAPELVTSASFVDRRSPR